MSLTLLQKVDGTKPDVLHISGCRLYLYEEDGHPEIGVCGDAGGTIKPLRELVEEHFDLHDPCSRGEIQCPKGRVNITITPDRGGWA